MTFNAGIEAAALKWPNGCHDPDSCSRHKRCMYVQCRNLNRDIKDEIGEAVAEQNTRPSSSAPVERREAVAWQAVRLSDGMLCGVTDISETADAWRRNESLTVRPLYAALPGSSRDEVLEESARVADGFTCGACGMDGKAPASIRALKSGVAKP